VTEPVDGDERVWFAYSQAAGRYIEELKADVAILRARSEPGVAREIVDTLVEAIGHRRPVAELLVSDTPPIAPTVDGFEPQLARLGSELDEAARNADGPGELGSGDLDPQFAELGSGLDEAARNAEGPDEVTAESAIPEDPSAESLQALGPKPGATFWSDEVSPGGVRRILHPFRRRTVPDTATEAA
jgi:hypothetical protein